MDRPKVTPELISTVAAAFCRSAGWDASQADDLARAYRSGMDGYELAKALGYYHGWIPTANDVEYLDEFGSEVREAHRQACIAWARNNSIQPPMPIGTMTTRGEITGVSDHDGATYLVRENGCTQECRRLLVRFEDAQVVEAPLQTPVMQHTPGPWTFALFERDPNEAFVQWRAGFAAVHGSRAGREANARLIAAAPDLLAALELTRGQWIHSVSAPACLAAIAAARGSDA